MKADKAATFEKLHQLTENAEYVYSEVKRNENERTSIPMFHYFVNNARIAGRDIPVKIQVRDLITSANSKETRYYTHTLEKNMRGNSGPVAGTQSANIDSNATAPSKTSIRSTEGNGQEKSSGRAGVEVSGINNRTATELDGADTVFADGSISVLSEEARYEILKDRTIRPASVEYYKLGDTDTAAIYESLSAAQMAQAKKAIPSHCDEAGAASGRSEKQQDQISVPILQRECRRKCAASERVRRTLYDGCNDKNKGIRRRKKAPSRRKRRGHFSAIGFQHQHTEYLPECQGRRRTISEVCTGRLPER